MCARPVRWRLHHKLGGHRTRPAQCLPRTQSGLLPDGPRTDSGRGPLLHGANPRLTLCLISFQWAGQAKITHSRFLGSGNRASPSLAQPSTSPTGCPWPVRRLALDSLREAARCADSPERRCAFCWARTHLRHLWPRTADQPPHRQAWRASPRPRIRRRMRRTYRARAVCSPASHARNNSAATSGRRSCAHHTKALTSRWACRVRHMIFYSMQKSSCGQAEIW